MSHNVAISELKTRIREVTNQDTSVPTNHHVLDSFLLRRINVYAAKLHSMLCRALPDFLAREADFATIANQTEYPLVDDFYTIISVRADDDSQVWQLPRYNMQRELADLHQLGINGSSTIHQYCYRIVRDKMHIRPTPTTAGHTITYVYNPAYADKVADTETIDGINGWEEYIVQEVAADVCQRDETDPALHLQRAAQMRAEIEALAYDRDEGPEYIQDVLGDGDMWQPRTGVPTRWRA